VTPLTSCGADPSHLLQDRRPRDSGDRGGVRTLDAVTGRCRPRTALVLVLVCLAAGCGERAQDTPRWLASPPVSPVSPPPARQDQPVELVLAFGGDVHFTGRTAALLRDPATAFGQARPLLAAADLAVVNLETAVTGRGTPEPKTFHFRAPASAYAAVRAAGVDAVSLANNHTLDYGQVGLADTLEAARDAGFPVFGAGRDADDAYRAWLTEVRGVRIAVLGFSLFSAWS